MKLSFNNHNTDVWKGYGHASTKMVNTLAINGFDVSYNIDNADLEVFFGHPQDYNFHNKKSIHIGYTDWESSAFLTGWKEKLEGIDEFWVGNQFCKDVFSEYTNQNIVIVPHGVDKVFTPQKRKYDGTLKFLHIGYPALRKNLYDVVNAFLELYEGRNDVTLTIKAYGKAVLDQYQGIDNINIISEDYTSFEMVNLMREHHCLVYPSWGEGFGLIPLQCLATGMPTIVTEGWCDYLEFVGNLSIDAKLTHNPFTCIHPGLMFKPNYQTIVDKMKYVEENIETLLDSYYNQAPSVIEKYGWENVLLPHFNNVKERFNL
jgi:glycosyltransferase involved in cell wall biosynthesis